MLTRSAVCVAAACCACGLFPDLGELSGGGASDASSDSPRGDAASDVASSPGFCASSKHSFCADFDTGTLGDGWSSKQVDAMGALSLTSERSVSAPRSLLATMSRRSAADPVEYALLEQQFDGWHHVVIEFEMYAKTPDWTMGDVNSGVVTFTYWSPSISTGGGAGLAMSMGQAYSTLGTPFTSGINGAPLATDAWIHVHIDFDPAGNVTASFGSVSLAGTFPALPSNPTTPTMTLTVGISGYNHPAPTYAIDYDNVTVDFL